MADRTAKYVGRNIPIRETEALLVGKGRYAADVALNRPLHVNFVRAEAACGRIRSIVLDDVDQGSSDVILHTGADVSDLGTLSVNPALPYDEPMSFPVLGQEGFQAVGQPIAAILATNNAAAQDAAERVVVDWEPTEFASRSVAKQSWRQGDVATAFAHSNTVVEVELRHPRLVPLTMEPRTISVAYDAKTSSVTVWHSTQTPHRSRSELASILGIDLARIRVIARDVGGGFGMKGSIYPEEVFAVWAAFKHERDVRWLASRSEDFLAASHGRGIRSHGRLALDASGRFLALEARVQAPIGPWMPNSGLIPAWNAGRILPSGYAVDAIDIHTEARTAFHGPAGIYRGAGRPEANALMERLVDKAARVLNRDPFELRLQNLLPSERMPAETATGNVLDSGDYKAVLRHLEDQAEYRARREKCRHRRDAGDLVGLGIAFYLEPSGSGWESARVTLLGDGRAELRSGSSSQGQARETSYAMIAADALDLDIGAISVIYADTDQAPEGIGAVASRSTAIGGSAVLEACLKAKAKEADGESYPIQVEERYENKGQAWGYGAYLAQVVVDPETGALTVEDMVCVDDAGRIIHPKLMEGQILGGVAQGLGEALMERVVYDRDGQLLTGSLMDYAVPRASDMPPISIHKTQTPSPMNSLGAKGVGEAGTIGAPIAVLNAAIDALSPLGVTDLQMPLTSETIWLAIRSAKEREA